jgi:hypothetical protein
MVGALCDRVIQIFEDLVARCLCLLVVEQEICWLRALIDRDVTVRGWPSLETGRRVVSTDGGHSERSLAPQECL